MEKYKQTALYSIFTRGLMVIIGPLVLVVMSFFLIEEEMAFYFTFLSLIAFKQLAELGISFTLKQFIAHEYILDVKGRLNESSKIKIKSYFVFSCKWFLAVSLFMLFFIGVGGWLFLDSYIGDIAWQYPWFFLILFLSISLLCMPIQILIEGMQKQHILYKSRLYYSIVNALVLISCFSFSFGLYALPISILVSNFVLYWSLKYYFTSAYNELGDQAPLSSKTVFKELWPVTSKVSITWGVSFFFWNSFNLIAFKYCDLILAGKLSFSLALGKAGYSISESLLSSQLAYFSQMIGNSNLESAMVRFKQFRFISVLFAIFGFSIALIIIYYNPGIDMLSKIVPFNIFWQICFFYTVLLIITSQNNFIRCFKIEPFVKLSMVNAVFVPFSFYYGIIYTPDYLFIGCIVTLLVNLYFSTKIFNSQVKKRLK